MNELNGHDIEDLKKGMTATFAKTITEADIVLFAGVSGDNNAIHINEEFAKTTRFGRPHRPRHAERERDLRGHRQQAAGTGDDLS